MADRAGCADHRSGAAVHRLVRLVSLLDQCGESHITEDTGVPLETLLPLDRLGTGREKQEIVFDRTYRIEKRKVIGDQ